MNEKAMAHSPESKYCFALDKNTVRLRLRISRDDRPEKVDVVYGGKYEFALKQNRLTAVRVCEDALFAYYTATLKLKDRRLVYVFEISDKGKTYYYSEDGLTGNYDFSLSFYNCFQYAYINDCDIHRGADWMKSAVFYQIFVDRFNIGDGKKDKSYINLKWGEKPTPKSFAGGDLKGICDKLDYISSLGANTIYLTPVFTSVSNHKYDIADYFEIDRQFGDKDDLKNLVEGAHKRGMKVVLDAVFNHCSENLKQFRDVLKNGRKSKYYNWFVINGDSPLEYECFASCKYMPKFNTSNREVRGYLISVATYWIKEFDIDGWRLDVSDEVSHGFWRDMRRAVKEIKEDCVLIGENWHDANVYLKGDQFDSIMNYAFTKACLDFYAFGTLSAQGFADRLNGILMRNTDTVNSMMLNLLDSHDTHRFLTQTGGDISKLLSALCVMFFFTGAPCIYYGTENAMEGGYDPDCRRTFDWNEEGCENTVKSLIKKLSELKKNPSFASAEVKIYAQDGQLIIERDNYKLTVGNEGFAID